MNEKGFSLVESVLVVAIVGATVFLIANIPNALTLIGKARHLSIAREIAAKQIEDKRSVSFANLTNDDSPLSDSRLSLLPQGNGRVVVEDCDPTICVSGESLKQVTIRVSWQDNNQTQDLILKTMIGEGGINQ